MKNGYVYHTGYDTEERIPAGSIQRAGQWSRKKCVILYRSRVVDPDPHWFWSAGSGSRREKITRKNRRRKKFMLVNRCFILRAEGFSCSLDVLLGNIFLFKTIFQQEKIYNVWSQKSWIQIRPHWSKMLDPDPHWYQCGSTTLYRSIQRLCVIKWSPNFEQIRQAEGANQAQVSFLYPSFYSILVLLPENLRTCFEPSV